MRPMRLNPGGSGVRGDSTPCCCRCCWPSCSSAASASAAAEALLCAVLPSAPRLRPPWLLLWRLPLESHGSSLLQGHTPEPQPPQTSHRSPCTSTSPYAGALQTCNAAEKVLRDALHLELFCDGSALLVRMRPGGWRLLRSEARDPSESASACSSSSSRRLQIASHSLRGQRVIREPYGTKQHAVPTKDSDCTGKPPASS
jgi:hypothetical protein